MPAPDLRPVERRVRRLADDGITDAEIAERFRRSPEWVRRVRSWSEVPRSHGQTATSSPLRPLERRILRWREQGAPHEAIASRFHRGDAFIRQVEQLARYKLAR